MLSANGLPRFERFTGLTNNFSIGLQVADAVKHGVPYSTAMDNALALSYGMPVVTRFNYSRPFILSKEDCESLGIPNSSCKLAMTFGSTIDCKGQPFKIYVLANVEYEANQIIQFSNIAVGDKVLDVSRPDSAFESTVIHSDFKFVPAFTGKLAYDRIRASDTEIEMFFSTSPARELGFSDLINYRKYISEALFELMGYPR